MKRFEILGSIRFGAETGCYPVMVRKGPGFGDWGPIAPYRQRPTRLRVLDPSYEVRADQCDVV